MKVLIQQLQLAMSISVKKSMFVAASVLALSGCAVNHKVEQEDTFFAPIMPETPAEEVVSTGSLYHTGWSNGLYSDTKARRVGDIITVMLMENTQASKTAKTETKKE